MNTWQLEYGDLNNKTFQRPNDMIFFQDIPLLNEKTFFSTFILKDNSTKCLQLRCNL